MASFAGNLSKEKQRSIIGTTAIDTTGNNEKNSPFSTASWVTVLGNRLWYPPYDGEIHHLAINVTVNNNTGAGAVLTAKINNVDVITINLGTGIGYFEEVTTKAPILAGGIDDFTFQYRNFDGTILQDGVNAVYEF